MEGKNGDAGSLLELIQAVESESDIKQEEEDKSWVLRYLGKVIVDEAFLYLLFFIIGLWVLFINEHFFCILLL